MLSNDTIVAQATPSGCGGVAVVRISGPLVTTIIQNIIRKTLPARLACYAQFVDAAGDCIDAGIAVFFPAPHSFTGEDVLELQGHGGVVVVDLLIKRVLSLGARLANPGEFSLRAFLNNKIDLTQAEAIADLIQANSASAARSAMRSLQGEFSKKITALSEKIINLRMHIEAAIDFAAEDIDFIGEESVGLALAELTNAIESIESQAKQGSLLREGVTVVIAGEPNVGKSSLLNALSGDDLAIVTPVPGTTRDVRREKIVLDGIPITLIDTAGLRVTEDLVEREGIHRAKREIREADIVLHVIDATDPESALDQDIVCQHTIKVVNKIDLLDGSEAKIDTQNPSMTTVFLSVQQNRGLDLLIQQMKSAMGFTDANHDAIYARRRHLQAITKAKDHLRASLKEWHQAKFGELIAEDLKQAHLALSEVTGEFSTDDLLGKIFSNFCIGK